MSLHGPKGAESRFFREPVPPRRSGIGRPLGPAFDPPPAGAHPRTIETCHSPRGKNRD